MTNEELVRTLIIASNSDTENIVVVTLLQMAAERIEELSKKVEAGFGVEK